MPIVPHLHHRVQGIHDVNGTLANLKSITLYDGRSADVLVEPNEPRRACWNA